MSGGIRKPTLQPPKNLTDKNFAWLPWPKNKSKTWENIAYWGVCSVADTFNLSSRPPGHNAASSISCVSSCNPSKSWSKSNSPKSRLLVSLSSKEIRSRSRFSQERDLPDFWSESFRYGYPSSFLGMIRLPWLKQALITYFSLNSPESWKIKVFDEMENERPSLKIKKFFCPEKFLYEGKLTITWFILTLVALWEIEYSLEQSFDRFRPILNNMDNWGNFRTILD